MSAPRSEPGPLDAPEAGREQRPPAVVVPGPAAAAAPAPPVTRPDTRVRPLDAAAAASAADPTARWGWSDAVLGVLALFVGGGLLAGLVQGLPGSAEFGVVALMIAYVLAYVTATWRPRRQHGGLRAAIALVPPRWSDAPSVLGWTVVLYIVPIVVVVALRQLPGLTGGDPGNAQFISQQGGLQLALTAVLTVVFAPVVEEVLFRGVMLQALMRRMGFWLAAVLSSLIFGALHMLSSADLRNAVLLLAATFILGMGLAVIVRRSGRLGPGMAVHAVHNLIVVLLVAQG